MTRLIALAILLFILFPLAGALSVAPQTFTSSAYPGQTLNAEVNVTTDSLQAVSFQTVVSKNTTPIDLAIVGLEAQIVNRTATIPFNITMPSGAKPEPISVRILASIEVAEIIQPAPSSGSSGGGGGIVGGIVVRNESACFYTQRLNGTLQKIPCHIVPQVVDTTEEPSVDIIDEEVPGVDSTPTTETLTPSRVVVQHIIAAMTLVFLLVVAIVVFPR